MICTLRVPVGRPGYRMSRSKLIRRGLLVGMGSAVAAHLLHCRREYNRDKPPVTMSKYLLLRTLPMHSMSAAAGFLAQLEIPKFLRTPLLSTYSRLYNVDLKECGALHTFPTFQSFFTRPLADGSRPVDRRARIVSPCDGTIVASGVVDGVDGRFEAVKGVFYNLSDLLGDRAPPFLSTSQAPSRWWPFSGSGGRKVHHVTIYLAPGDYHRFHSPADMTIMTCDRHDGMKLPVAPLFISHIAPDTLRLNSRALILSESGGVAMVPVGALNVSSIDVSLLDVSSSGVSPGGGVAVRKGDLLGQFKLGSTIMLFFTADSDITVPCGPIKMGQRIH